LSEARHVFTDDDENDLAILSGCNNKQRHITGYLCFFRNKFFQYIEGPETDVIVLMDIIRKDPRHNIIFETRPLFIESRKFPNWCMRSLSKHEFASVYMEDCIKQSLHFIDSNQFNSEVCTEKLLRQLSRISMLNRRNTMNNYTP